MGEHLKMGHLNWVSCLLDFAPRNSLIWRSSSVTAVKFLTSIYIDSKVCSIPLLKNKTTVKGRENY